MTIRKWLLRPLVAAGTAAVLGACATLPSSGPSLRDVEAAGASSNGIEIIDVTDTVAKELTDSHRSSLFSDMFQEAAGDNEIVGPGDVLEVSVWEAPPAALFSSAMKDSALPAVSNMTAFPQQMVNGAGTIYVPFAGEVAAAGKTAQDIAADVAKRLRGKANAPQVLVRLVANNTNYVTVVGEVSNSMRMPLTARRERLLDALAAAGGTKQDIEKVTLQVTRGTTVHALPLATVIRDPRQNIILEPGDVVTALFQPLSFTALGATGKSDEVSFEAKGISLAQALARSGGLIDIRANPQGVFIFRFEAPDALNWPVSPTTTPEGYVPVIYRVNLKDPRSFFVAQSFTIRNKDMLYIANAPAAELQKFLNLLVSTVYPVEGAVVLTRQ
jgi:polysaccharide export outer membrane protein